MTPPDRLLPSGLRVRAAFSHRGPGRALVHNLKYRGIGPAGEVLAAAMAPLIPPGTVLVPLERVGWRRLRHGIDPATVLCERLASLTGQSVAHLLAAPWFGPVQASRSRSQRRAPIFRLRGWPEGPVVLVDDVVTTGGTIERARELIGTAVTMAVTATAVSD
ncbi:MAG TPA: hypothetical protein VIA81_06770 [Acidimicrobiia bacterium]